jgi:hypothetical protein
MIPSDLDWIWELLEGTDDGNERELSKQKERVDYD